MRLYPFELVIRVTNAWGECVQQVTQRQPSTQGFEHTTYDQIADQFHQFTMFLMFYGATLYLPVLTYIHSHPLTS